MIASNPHVLRIVRLAIEEDLSTGDVTTETTVPESARMRAEVVAKAAGVLAGLPVARLVLREIDPALEVEEMAVDGAEVVPGQVVMRARGSARSLLVAERTLLNFVMRLSGIATRTREFVQALEGRKTALLDTRKTTPGHRVLDKYAVRAGGGRNHRLDLAGGVLIKNNHIAIQGDLKACIRAARANCPSLCRVEVEVRTLEEVKRAIEAGADVLLLDHMNQDEIAQAVDYANWKVQIEVSGNMTPEKAAAAADLGVDFVSAGAITYAAPWLDFSMYLHPEVDDARP